MVEDKVAGETSGNQEQLSQTESFNKEQVAKMLTEAEQRLQAKFQQIADREAGKWQGAAAKALQELEAYKQAFGEVDAEKEAYRRKMVENLSPEEALKLDIEDIKRTLKRPQPSVAMPAVPITPTVSGVEIVKKLLKEHGISEEEIDLAADSPDVAQGLERFVKSLIKRYEKKGKEATEATVLKVRKELGADVVDTSGGGASSRKSFTTKQIREMSIEDKLKNADAIRKAFDEGRLKIE